MYKDELYTSLAKHRISITYTTGIQILHKFFKFAKISTRKFFHLQDNKTVTSTRSTISRLGASRSYPRWESFLKLSCLVTPSPWSMSWKKTVNVYRRIKIFNSKFHRFKFHTELNFIVHIHIIKHILHITFVHIKNIII